MEGGGCEVVVGGGVDGGEPTNTERAVSTELTVKHFVLPSFARHCCDYIDGLSRQNCQ